MGIGDWNDGMDQDVEIEAFEEGWERADDEIFHDGWLDDSIEHELTDGY